MQTKKQAWLAGLLAAGLMCNGQASLLAGARTADDPGGAGVVAAAAEDLDSYRSEMRPLIERYADDRASLMRVYPLRLSSARSERMKRFYTEWREKLDPLNFNAMSPEGRVDYVLFQSHLDHELVQLEIEAKRLAEMEPLIPFRGAIIELEETRRAMRDVKARGAAEVLNQLKAQVTETQKRVEAGLPAAPGRGGNRGAAGASDSSQEKKDEQKLEPLRAKKVVANRALGAVGSLRGTLRSWFSFYNEYDPVFSWWCEAPYKEADEALDAYAKFLAEKVLGLRLQQEGRGGAAGGWSRGTAAAERRPAGGGGAGGRHQ